MKLDGILPLKVSGSYGVEDLARADILMASLSAFGDKQLFGTLLIVTPDEEVEQVRAHLSSWKTLPIHVTSESVLAPELQNYPRLRGWRKQQILKLAAPRVLITLFSSLLMLMCFVPDLLLPATCARVIKRLSNTKTEACTQSGGPRRPEF